MPVPYELQYEISDADNDKGRFGWFIPNTFSLTDITTAARTWAGYINSIISGVINSVSLTIDIDLSGITNNSGVVTSDVEEIAHFQYLTVDGDQLEINIPGMNEGIVGTGSDDLDQSNVDVAAFDSAVKNGIVTPGGTIRITDVAEGLPVTLVQAKERSRPSGRRR